MIPVRVPRVRANFFTRAAPRLSCGERFIRQTFGKKRCGEAHSTRLTLFDMLQCSNETNTRLTLCGELWLPTKTLISLKQCFYVFDI
jgi:hypothetical protein